MLQAQSELSFAIALNNNAVACIHEGNYEEAANILVQALCSTKRYLYGCDNSLGEANQKSQSTDLNVFRIRSHVMPCDAEVFRPEIQQGQTVYMYNRPFMIPTCSCHLAFPSCNSSEEENLRSAAHGTTIIFNLALSYHLASKTSILVRTSYLQKAAKLYELAYNMCSVDTENRFATIRSSGTLFVLATLNNMGLIYSQLKDSCRSNQCFGSILSMMVYILDDSSERIHNFADLEVFLRNVSVFLVETNKAAAAA